MSKLFAIPGLSRSALKYIIMTGLLFGWVFSFPLKGMYQFTGGLFNNNPAMSFCYIAGFCMTFLLMTIKPVSSRMVRKNFSKVSALSLSILAIIDCVIPLNPTMRAFLYLLLGIFAAQLIISILSCILQEKPQIWIVSVSLLTIYTVYIVIEIISNLNKTLSEIIIWVLPLAFVMLVPDRKIVSPFTQHSTGFSKFQFPIAIFILTAVYIPVDLISCHYFYTVNNSVTPAYFILYALYYPIILLLSFFSNKFGHKLLAEISLSALGSGLVIFLVFPGVSAISILILFCLLIGISAVEMYYCISLWNTASYFGNAGAFGIGFAIYFAVFTLSSVVLKNFTPLLLNPLPALFLVINLFISIPIILRLDRKTNSSGSNVINPRIINDMSEVEQKIFNLICRGYTNKEIASELIMSPHTVKYYARRILRKTDFKNRYELRAVLSKKQS